MAARSDLYVYEPADAAAVEADFVRLVFVGTGAA
jgi:hypothetical protein